MDHSRYESSLLEDLPLKSAATDGKQRSPHTHPSAQQGSQSSHLSSSSTVQSRSQLLRRQRNRRATNECPLSSKVVTSKEKKTKDRQIPSVLVLPTPVSHHGEEDSEGRIAIGKNADGTSFSTDGKPNLERELSGLSSDRMSSITSSWMLQQVASVSELLTGATIPKIGLDKQHATIPHTSGGIGSTSSKDTDEGESDNISDCFAIPAQITQHVNVPNQKYPHSPQKMQKDVIMETVISVPQKIAEREIGGDDDSINQELHAVRMSNLIKCDFPVRSTHTKNKGLGSTEVENTLNLDDDVSVDSLSEYNNNIDDGPRSSQTDTMFITTDDGKTRELGAIRGGNVLSVDFPQPDMKHEKPESMIAYGSNYNSYDGEKQTDEESSDQEVDHQQFIRGAKLIDIDLSKSRTSDERSDMVESDYDVGTHLTVDTTFAPAQQKTSYRVHIRAPVNDSTIPSSKHPLPTQLEDTHTGGMEDVHASQVAAISTNQDLFSDAEMVESSAPLDSSTSAEGQAFEVEYNEEGSAEAASRESSRTSFTADSPYYTSYVEKEVQELTVLSETLKEISARAQTFGKCGALMSESTRRLSLACRLYPSEPQSETSDDDEQQEKNRRSRAQRKECVGEEMGSVLQVLGDVLDEVADAQIQMCEALEATLSMSLEAFATTEFGEVINLKNEAEQCTESAETSFSKFYNSRNAEKLQQQNLIDGESSLSLNATSWNKLSTEVGSQINSTLKNWSSSTEQGGRMGTFKGWRSGSNINASSEGTAPATQGRKKKNKEKEDPTLVMATTAANIRRTLEQIRLAQGNAELKRFRLVKKLVSIKKRRNFDLGETCLASLHGIRAYFHHCSDLMQGLSPKMNKIQCKQKDSRDIYDEEQNPWDAREQGLVKAVDVINESATNAGFIAEAIAQGEALLADNQPTSLNEIERQVQFWDLPHTLAASSRYQREPSPGVIVEGWLYKKTSSRISLQQWNKRWFMMDRDAIYYFRTDERKQNAVSYLDTLERVKVCDIVLCSVREVSDSYRYCFEIFTPNHKPIVVQSSGPLDYRMWVDGIRSCIETQLVHGDIPPEQLMQNIGKSKNKRRSENSGTEAKPTLGSMLSDAGDAGVTFRGPSDTESGEDDDAPTSADQDLLVNMKPEDTLAQEIMEANAMCADCGSRDPDWVSVNLGVLLCIECSGVHRSLGVHVSKIRSLKLDSLSQPEGRLLLRLGNDRVNPIWEAGVAQQKGWIKPIQKSTREEKENWIKSKYLWKGFLVFSPSDGKNATERESTFSDKLYEAARRCDVLEVSKYLALGANIEWKNETESGKTSLHICALGKHSDDGTWQGIECAELLIQNGAKIDTLDFDTQTALDCAVCGNGERQMVEYLSEKGETTARFEA